MIKQRILDNMAPRHIHFYRAILKGVIGNYIVHLNDLIVTFLSYSNFKSIIHQKSNWICKNYIGISQSRHEIETNTCKYMYILMNTGKIVDRRSIFWRNSVTKEYTCTFTLISYTLWKVANCYNTLKSAEIGHKNMNWSTENSLLRKRCIHVI